MENELARVGEAGRTSALLVARLGTSLPDTDQSLG
jgi:hypothetical protein